MTDHSIDPPGAPRRPSDRALFDTSGATGELTTTVDRATMTGVMQR